MTEETTQLIKERLALLAPELKAVIAGDKWGQETQKISRQFGLNDERTEALSQEIMLVLLGFEASADMSRNLVDVLNLNEMITSKIAQAAQEAIFNPIKTYLPTEDMPLRELPDASQGLIADHEEVIENPLTPTSIANIAPQKITPVISQNAPAPTQEKKITAVPAGQLSWEERKKRAEEVLKNVIPSEPKKYPGGADPYREAI